MNLTFDQEYILSFLDDGLRHMIGRDRTSRSIVDQLEKMRLVKVDRSFDCWVIRKLT